MAFFELLRDNNGLDSALSAGSEHITAGINASCLSEYDCHECVLRVYRSGGVSKEEN